MATKVKTKETGLTLASQYTQKDVPTMIGQLKSQLETLKGDNKDDVSLDINYNGKKIKDTSTVKELLEISASIHARAAAYAVEITRYNLQSAMIQGFSQEDKTVKEWEAIISKAINELINKVQIKKIEEAIKDLSEHLDADTRLANKLADIMGSAAQPIQ